MAIARSMDAGATTILERDDELRELSACLAEASAGVGSFVVVRGEAGIGKTALVDAFLSGVPGETAVYRTLCDGVSTPRPFGPIHEIAAQLHGELPRVLEDGSPRHAVNARVLDCLNRVSSVLALDDLQWADEATAELLAYIARRVAGMPLLVLATLRDDDEPAPPIRRLLGQLAGTRAVRQLALRRLSPAGVARMAAGTDTDAAELYQLTGGNPFFLTQVLEAGSGRVPVSISDALTARLARLTERGRAALNAAAVIGSRSEPWLLAAVAGEDVLGADDCIDAGLLTTGQMVAFRHELTRVAVLEQLPVFRRISLHRRALEALERGGTTDAARLAYHAEAAGDGAAVLRYAVPAAEAAMRAGAYHQAAEQLRRTDRFMDRAEPAQQARVLEMLGSVLYSVNRMPEAYDVRQRALSLRRRIGDAMGIGVNERELAKLEYWRGEGAQGRTRLLHAIGLLELLGESGELAQAYAFHGALLCEQDREAARAWLHRALELGRRVGEPEAVAMALNQLGGMALIQGDDHGEDLLLESLELAREHGLYERAHAALFNLAIVFAERREPVRARTYLDQLVDYVSGVQVERCNLDGVRSAIELDTGAWTDAERSAGRALVYARTPSDDQALALTVLATLAIRRGQGEWRSLLDTAEGVVAGYGDFGYFAPMIAARAEAAWLEGTLSGMIPRLAEGFTWARATKNPWRIGEFGMWLWAAGDMARPPRGAAEPYRLAVAGDRRGAAAAFDARRMPYAAALALAMSDEPSELQDAHQRLATLGAGAARALVAAKLRAAGAPVPRGPRPATRRNPAGLTDRELEVAQLISEGLTNRQIAGALILAEKTVAHHVSAVLGRLGVERRTLVGAALSAAGQPG
ncbi:MAG: AAA family ATPase [Chloroflexi bacterium]|nr:AAA family ATPase [Chloroflexota bacterium]